MFPSVRRGSQAPFVASASCDWLDQTFLTRIQTSKSKTTNQKIFSQPRKEKATELPSPVFKATEYPQGESAEELPKTTKKSTASRKHQYTQTLNWKELPYGERRNLVTKMYGTISTDRKPRPDSQDSKCSHSPRRIVGRINLAVLES